MKRVLLTILVVAAGWLLGSPRAANSDVSVAITSPVVGSVVSNTITLSANATSLAGKIQRVEHYIDGKLFATITNRFDPPGVVKVQ